MFLKLSSILMIAPIAWFSTTTQALPSQKNDQAQLGRYLFHDVRLSENGIRSCALCHNPDEGWTNSFSKVPDIHGKQTNINTPAILNSLFNPFKSIKNQSVTQLKTAIENPLLSTHPIEMGMTPTLVEQRLNEAKDIYAPLFKSAFGSPEITYPKVIQALSTFVSKIQSVDTCYHRHLAGRKDALNEDAKKGLALFESNRLKCSSCHSGKYLNQTKSTGRVEFYNVGLYGIADEKGNYVYPAHENGVRFYTGKLSDDGKYRTPSLINVADTGPWGHDGSFNRLEDVIDHYSRGGREIEEGENKGDGKLSSAKHPDIAGFEITPEEKKQLLAFLQALSIHNAKNLSVYGQAPFCQLIKLKNKKDTPNCIEPYRVNPS